jgi:hypothetical protein
VGVGLERRDEPVAAEGDHPSTANSQPRFSRTDCQMSQAPPISAIAARANR